MPPTEIDKISIIRPDGSTFTGTPEQLKKLQVLGNYREQTLDDVQLDLRDAADKRRFSTPLEKLKTAGEGALSGATLGGSDLLFNSTESDLRAEANPGTRLAGELGGGILTAVASGGTGTLAKVAGATPAGMVTKLGQAGASLVESKLAGAAIAGGIEGLGAGMQSELSTATLNNDPITVGHVITGMGWGAIFGAGLNAGIHGAGKALERGGKAIEPTMVTKPKDILPDEAYQPFKSSIADVDQSLQAIDAGIDDAQRQILEKRASDVAAIKGYDDAASVLRIQKRNAGYEHTLQVDSMQAEQASAIKDAKKYADEDIQSLTNQRSEFSRQHSDEVATARAELDTTKYADFESQAKRDLDAVKGQAKLNDKAVKRAYKDNVAQAEKELAAEEAALQDHYKTVGKDIPKAQNTYGYSDTVNEMDNLAGEIRLHTVDTEGGSMAHAATLKDLNEASQIAKKAISGGDFVDIDEALQVYHDALKSANKLTGYNRIVPDLVQKNAAETAQDWLTEDFKTRIKLAQDNLASVKKMSIATNHAERVKLAEQNLDRVREAKRAAIEAKNNRIVELKRSHADRLAKHDELITKRKGLHQSIVDGFDTGEVRDLKRSHITAQQARDAEIDSYKAAKANHVPEVTDHISKSINDLKELRKHVEVIKGIPHTAAGFRGMGDSKINDIVAAVKAVSSSTVVSPLAISTKAAVDSLAERIGINIEGGPADKLLGIWKSTKGVQGIGELSEVEQAVMEHRSSGIGNGLERSFAASAFARATGTGSMGYFGAKGFMQGAGEAKMKVQKFLSSAAKKIGKSWQKPTKNYILPKLEPLYTKLDGSRDPEKNKNKAAANRVNELVGLAGSINDITYRAIEPVIGQHPEFAQEMHAQLVQKAAAFVAELPKDSLFLVMKGVHTYRPNDVDTLVISKALRAFFHPLSVIGEMAENGVDAISVKILNAVHKEAMDTFRDTILNTVDMSKLGYRAQQQMSMLGITVSSMFDKENTADALKQWVENPAPQPGAGKGNGTKSNGGRPAATEQATTGQGLATKGM